MSEDIEGAGDEPRPPIVHWMQPRPLSLPGGVSATAASAFALGAVTAVAILALARWLNPGRR